MNCGYFPLRCELKIWLPYNIVKVIVAQPIIDPISGFLSSTHISPDVNCKPIFLYLLIDRWRWETITFNC